MPRKSWGRCLAVTLLLPLTIVAQCEEASKPVNLILPNCLLCRGGAKSNKQKKGTLKKTHEKQDALYFLMNVKHNITPPRSLDR